MTRIENHGPCMDCGATVHDPAEYHPRWMCELYRFVGEDDAAKVDEELQRALRRSHETIAVLA
jgi:hypothetical protein